MLRGFKSTFVGICLIGAAAVATTSSFAATKAGKARAPFGQLKTIYVVPGLYDSTVKTSATVVHCTNVSGTTVTIRFLALNSQGGLLADKSINVPNGGTRTATTRSISVYAPEVNLNTSVVAQGALNVESTDSAVFCSAEVVHTDTNYVLGVSRHMIRVNGLPGTQE